MSDIVKDSVVEFSRLQNWMLSAKENNDTATYNMMLDRYIELRKKGCYNSILFFLFFYFLNIFVLHSSFFV